MPMLNSQTTWTCNQASNLLHEVNNSVPAELGSETAPEAETAAVGVGEGWPEVNKNLVTQDLAFYKK